MCYVSGLIVLSSLNLIIVEVGSRDMNTREVVLASLPLSLPPTFLAPRVPVIAAH